MAAINNGSQIQRIPFYIYAHFLQYWVISKVSAISNRLL